MKSERSLLAILIDSDWFLLPTANEERTFASSVQGTPLRVSADNMKKDSDQGLRPEYDLSKLEGGVRGKYHEQAKSGSNLRLLDPELARIFPDEESVNRALRLLVDTADAARNADRKT